MKTRNLSYESYCKEWSENSFVGQLHIRQVALLTEGRDHNKRLKYSEMKILELYDNIMSYELEYWEATELWIQQSLVRFVVPRLILPF